MRALREIVLAVGLLCFIEGALYALWPDGMKRMLEMLQGQQPDRLRAVGLAAAAAGVALMWLAR